MAASPRRRSGHALFGILGAAARGADRPRASAALLLLPPRDRPRKRCTATQKRGSRDFAPRKSGLGFHRIFKNKQTLWGGKRNARHAFGKRQIRGWILVPAPPAWVIPPLFVWPCGTPFGNTQEGPDRLRSAPITDPLSRGFRESEGSERARESSIWNYSINGWSRAPPAHGLNGNR